MLPRSLVRSCTRLGRVAARPPLASASVTLPEGMTASSVGRTDSTFSSSFGPTATMKSASSKRFDAASSL